MASMLIHIKFSWLQNLMGLIYLEYWLNKNKNRKTSVLIHTDQCGQPIILSWDKLAACQPKKRIRGQTYFLLSPSLQSISDVCVTTLPPSSPGPIYSAMGLSSQRLHGSSFIPAAQQSPSSIIPELKS